MQVNKKWKELLTTESYQNKGKSVFHGEISEDETKLWKAAGNGNIEEVQNSLSIIFVNVNCSRGSKESTPLSEAAENKYEKVVKVLLDAGADPNKADKYETTPIYWATSNNLNQVIKLLLDGGANPDLTNNYGDTPLILAAYRGSNDVVQLLLDAGANPNRAYFGRMTPLH